MNGCNDGPRIGAWIGTFWRWYVAKSDDKKRVRLNIITHLLGSIPYKETPRVKVELPKRKKAGK